MAKKLGKKARKFARKHLQTAAKRNRKIRSQFNHRRTRRGGSAREEGRPGDGDEDVPRRVDDATMDTNDPAATLVNGLEFPEDEAEINTDLSDSDGYLSEDPECPYYSDSEDGDGVKDCIMQDGFDKQNDEMNLDIKKTKEKVEEVAG
uniref:Uncharacterized protein n=1 Tax=Arundo donax TaxID=35708 RepID=A0A0A9DDY3_ARUDO